MSWQVSRRRFLQLCGGSAAALVLKPDRAGARTGDWVDEGIFPRVGTLTSRPLAADQPFNGVVATWDATLPPGAGLLLELRASPDGSDWLPWTAIPPDLHQRLSDPAPAFSNLYLIGPSQFLQYRVTLTAGEAAPELRQLRLQVLDTSAGPDPAGSTDDALVSATDVQSAAVPTVAIVTRAQWGADESLRFKDGKEIWPREYQTWQKVIVHHTASSNSVTDAAASVRAIYHFHAVDKGWGDLGYHFLIAPDGKIYEGRIGGDNVVGGHAVQYNRGSLGVALLGEFTREVPTAAALNALATLLAVKARAIPPQGRGYFIDKDLPNYMGHRDCLSTECPGDQMYARLPTLRRQVEQGAGAPLVTRAEISRVSITPRNVALGDNLRVEVTVKNTGTAILATQDPSPAFVYEQGDNFTSRNLPKLTGKFRTCLDFDGNGSQVPNPYRWGLGSPLSPGDSTTVVGLVRIKEAGLRTYWAGLVEEFIRYHQEKAGSTLINAVPLPTAPVDAIVGNPHARFFPETRHNVGYDFLTYWDANGGLFQFGYPLTEGFSELNETDGQVYNVQYFERARFEYHPENKGTPYEVLLGQLGRELTQGRGFSAVDAVPSSETRLYFPETRHTLSWGFKTYWEKSGGLARYGFPISEEFDEVNPTDGKTYTVQYFERARFEYHAENQGTPYEVLLGHLGREVLARRGWLR